VYAYLSDGLSLPSARPVRVKLVFFFLFGRGTVTLPSGDWHLVGRPDPVAPDRGEAVWCFERFKADSTLFRGQ